MPDNPETLPQPDALQAADATQTIGLKAYVALFLVICFFSGIFGYCDNCLSVLDFNRLLGKFGLMGDTGASFVGKGGSGVRHGFLFALSLIPSIMLALAIVNVAEYFGAIRAAQKLLTPLMRPLLGLPGGTGLALLTSLQSSDAGGAMTRELYDSGRITDKERSIFGAFQFSAGSAVTVYLTAVPALAHALEVSYLVPLAVILFYKVLGTNLMRLYLYLVVDTKSTAGNDNAQ